MAKPFTTLLPPILRTLAGQRATMVGGVPVNLLFVERGSPWRVAEATAMELKTALQHPLLAPLPEGYRLLSAAAMWELGLRPHLRDALSRACEEPARDPQLAAAVWCRKFPPRYEAVLTETTTSEAARRSLMELAYAGPEGAFVAEGACAVCAVSPKAAAALVRQAYDYYSKETRR